MPDQISSFVQLIATAAIPVIFGITLHEVSHGWVARYYGDRTAEMLGRLSLNPLRHIDPVGTVAVPLIMAWLGGFLFGWAKPVPVNARAMRNPRRAMMVVAAAGPLSNFVMAIAWALGLHLMNAISLPPAADQFVLRMISFGIIFNVLLGVFNLLPIPPLDGSRVLRGLVPESIGRKLDAIEPYGLIIVIALLALGFVNELIAPLFGVVQDLVLRVAGVKGMWG